MNLTCFHSTKFQGLSKTILLPEIYFVLFIETTFVATVGLRRCHTWQRNAGATRVLHEGGRGGKRIWRWGWLNRVAEMGWLKRSLARTKKGRSHIQFLKSKICFAFVILLKTSF